MKYQDPAISTRRALNGVVIGAAIVCACGLGPALEARAQGRAAQGRQGPPPGRLGRQAAPDDGTTPAELQQLMDTMVVVEAQKQLQLSDQQFAQFLRRLNMLLDGRRRRNNQRNRALMELRRVMQDVDGKADDAQVNEQLKALEDLETQSASEDKQARVNIDQVLTVRQRARFRLIEEQVERRKLELFARSRQPVGNQPPPPK